MSDKVYTGTILELTLKLYLLFCAGFITRLVNYDRLKRILKQLKELRFSLKYGLGKVTIPSYKYSINKEMVDNVYICKVGIDLILVDVKVLLTNRTNPPSFLLKDLEETNDCLPYSGSTGFIFEGLERKLLSDRVILKIMQLDENIYKIYSPNHNGNMAISFKLNHHPVDESINDLSYLDSDDRKGLMDIIVNAVKCDEIVKSLRLKYGYDSKIYIYLYSILEVPRSPSYDKLVSYVRCYA